VAERMFSLAKAEKARLRSGLQAAFEIPIIDDVEDYVWEAVFHHVKNIPLKNPITQGRTKELFDAVAADGRGWSLKTLLCSNQEIGSNFEFIIQRADIFKKANDLGFPGGLHAQSAPNRLGKALVRHWNAKFQKDSKTQGVTDPRICILLKNRSRKDFTYVEFAYPALDENDFRWSWSKKDGLGLKGFRQERVRLKWYHGQKQLFEVFQIPNKAYKFHLDWKRAELEDFMVKAAKMLP
jgi:hypothetical protein